MAGQVEQLLGPGAGDVVLERYRLEKALGTGPFATVYRAADLELRSAVVAVKKIHPHLITSENVRVALRAQVLDMRQLSHTHIIRTYDLEEDADGQLYIITEICEGWNLAQLLEERSGRPLKLASAIYTLSCISSALSYAHRKGVVHTNLKPTNILLDRSGGIKICDFGLNRAFDEADGFTATGEAVANPRYMAPEQFTLGTISPQTDLYSFAVLGYQLVCGSGRIQKDDYMSFARTHIGGELPTIFQQEEIPLWLNSIFSSCCAADPADRPASAKCIHKELQAWQQNNSINTKQVLNSLSPKQLQTEYKKWRFGAAVIICFTLTASILTLLQADTQQRLTTVLFKTEGTLNVNLSVVKRPFTIDYFVNDPYCLHKAVTAHDFFSVRALIKAGAVGEQLDENGETAFHKIMRFFSPLEIISLIPKMRDLDIVDSHGNSLLHLAVYNGDTVLVDTLLEHGAATDIVNNQGLNPLQLGLRFDIWKPLPKLLKAERTPSRRTLDGKTLVMLALENFKMSSWLMTKLQVLFEHHASALGRDNNGLTSLDYAERTNIPEVIELVKKQTELELRAKTEAEFDGI